MPKLISRVRQCLSKKLNIEMVRTECCKYSDGEKYWFTYNKNQKDKFRVHIYEGYVRTDYPKGFIAIDFDETYNKIGQCPILCSIDEPLQNVYEMIDTLEKLGSECSNQFGRFVKCPKCNKWRMLGGTYDTFPYEIEMGYEDEVNETGFGYKCKICNTFFKRD